MGENLNGIRKEYVQQAMFRTLLAAALETYPDVRPFNVNDVNVDQQIEKWKAISAEQSGFDKCFKMITGFYPKDFKND